MIKARICVERTDNLKQAYLILKDSKSIEILDINNELEKQIPNVGLKIMYNRHIIAHVDIVCGENAPNYNAR